MADTLKNLQYMTINKGMKHIIGGDKMSHFPDMRIQDDSTLYAKLLEKKRSTFDRSKFEVVGSPTIMDDGIASGFSSNSFLQISINLSNKPFIFETPKFVYSQVASDRQYLFTYGSYGTGLFMQTFITSTGALNTSMRNNNTDIFYKSYQLTLNNSYQIKYVLNNTEASIYLKTNDNDYELWYTTTNTSLYTVNNTNMCIGQENNGSTRFYLGSIDLKQFSITVDGKEVFNGNKTGIDTIKPDNYTVVGSPTITEDGVASGFSNSAYLKHSIIKTGNSVKIKIRIKTSTLDGNTRYVLRGLDGDLPSGAGAMGLLISNTDKLWLIGYTSSGVYTNVGNYIINADTEYLIEAEYTSNKITYKVNNTDVATISGSYKLPKSFSLGNSFSSDAPFMGSIDLNSFRIYVDGQLVYQPTLRIPYTQSKTDEKIVDAVYRDRVQDMYEQFGYTHYYTIGNEPEKYNVGVVGSPTLVAGVASGLNNDNNIQLNNSIQIGASSNFKIEFQFTVGNTWVENWIFAAATANNFCLWLGKNNLDVYMNNVHIRNLPNGFAQNGSYKGYLKREGRIYTIYCENLKTHTSTTQTATATEDYSFSGALWIGKSGNSRDWSTDLKQFSITVDGKEVFRGYEPAITDAFTLATHKGTDVIESYSDGEGTYYEVRADLVQRCVGQIPINTTEVTYPREFRDEKNIVQVAYFNIGESTATPMITHIAPKVQTKSGFTIGATTNLLRNYYAEGKAVLG